MRLHPFITAILFFACFTASVTGQEQQAKELVVSLAQDSNPIVFTQDPGSYKLRFLHLVPTAEYLIAETRVVVNPQQLRGITFGETGDDETEVEYCGGLQNAIIDVLRSNTEKEVADALRKIRFFESGCSDEETLASANEVVARTERVVGPATVTANDGWRFDVVRIDTGQKWTISVLPPRSSWFVSYGFNGFPDEDEDYFTKSTTANGQTTFSIEPKRTDSEDYDIAPSVVVTYLLHQWTPWGESPLLGLGISAGAGVEGEEVKPVLTLGITGLIGDNVFLTGGAIFHPQKRLLGELSPGPTPSALTDAQLHKETHDWNWFFGLSFRFDRSDKKAQDKGKQTGNSDPKPAVKPREKAGDRTEEKPPELR